MWIWAEKTDYGLSRQPALNPFVASVANQTFNTNQEAVTAFAEDFTTDPLRRGWYFDFDMLAIGKKVNPEHTVPLMSTDTLPYVWSKDDKAVRVQGTWLAGPEGNVVAKLGQQRRRYVHPLQILNKTDDFQVEFDFQVERFGSDSANPIVFGLFNSGELVNRQALVLRIDGPEAVDIILVGDSNPWVSRLDVKGGLKTNTPYRLALAYDGSAGRLQAKLITRADPSLVSQLAGTVPASEGQFQWDEVGVAQWDANETFTPVEKAYQYRLEGVRLDRK